MKKVLLLFLILIATALVAYKILTKVNLNQEHYVGEKLDSLNGVFVYYNGGVNNVTERHLTLGGYNLGLKYQCVEFVKRYYFEFYGHQMPDSYGHAKDFYDHSLLDGEFNQRRALVQFSNPSKTMPAVGDLVVYSPTTLNPYGHVAIVSRVGTIAIEIIQQNAGPFSPSREQYPLSNNHSRWKINNDRIVGWLRMKQEDNP